MRDQPPTRIDLNRPGVTRRRLLIGAGLAAPALALGYSGLLPAKKIRAALMNTGETLAHGAHNLIGRKALAREYGPEDISPDFRTNGSVRPEAMDWALHAEESFVNWRLQVDGLVDKPLKLSLREMKALPARTQITRHDCVEGWSAIAGWTGVPLAAILNTAGLTSDARYIVFWCADAFRGWQYYESIDLIDAFHPQTILAYGMNGADLPPAHGAPLRLRVERQLGYKQAKFITRIEAVADLAGAGHGKGGFWEDVSGYEWYAGI